MGLGKSDGAVGVVADQLGTVELPQDRRLAALWVQGTHDALMASGGVYRRLVEHQLIVTE